MSDSRPNVLWLMTDEQRTDSMGCYGSRWARTPNLDTLAAEGTVCRTALTPAPVCLPARLSLSTGQYTSRHEVWWNEDHHGKALRHLTKVFEQAGYRTAGFGKNHYGKGQQVFQTQEGPTLGDTVGYFKYKPPYEDESKYDVVKYPPEPYPWIFGGRLPAGPDTTGEWRTVRKAIDWLDAQDRSQPFLLHVSFNGPHTPVVPPVPFDAAIDEDAIALSEQAEGLAENTPEWLAGPMRQIAGSHRLTAEQIRKMRRYYYGEVAFLDQQFGVLLEALRQRGLMENTIVAYVSDHGTHLGDYGFVQKQTFYEPVVNVPFFFRAPGRVAAGRMLETPVETRSLLPTLLELAGLECPADCRDASLAAALHRGAEPPARPVFSEFMLESFKVSRGKLILVRDGQWKLSLRLDPEVCDQALYDLATDPCERHNLAGKPASAAVQDRLTGLIRQHVQGYR